MKKILFLLFLVSGAVSMIAMSAHYLLHSGTGILANKPVGEFGWYVLTFRLHVLGGLVAISLGPLQFVKQLRIRFLVVHRLVGYLYVGSIVVSALCGLAIAQFAMGGIITTTGFTLLSCTWLSVTILALVSVRKGEISEHRRWAYFSYGLTFAAITQRTLLLVPLLTPVPFLPIYQLSAWLPWILNLMIAAALLKNTQSTSEISHFETARMKI